MIFALISELPFNLMLSGGFFYPLHQNVIFTFLIAFDAMALCEKKIRARFPRLIGILLCIAVTLVFYFAGFLTFVDYYGFGVLTVLVFHFTRTAKDAPAEKKLLAAAIQVLSLYYINFDLMGGLSFPITAFGQELWLPQQGLAILSLPLIWLYRGKQGPYNKSIRALYYAFYPAHLLLLALLMIFL